jgi:hypothetical protein
MDADLIIALTGLLTTIGGFIFGQKRGTKKAACKKKHAPETEE